MDFYDPSDMQRFFEMDADERKEALHDWLATVAEPWQGDGDDDKLARSMVGAMATLMNASDQVDNLNTVNRHVLGLWLNTYMHMARGFQTLAALGDVKKSFEKKKGEDT